MNAHPSHAQPANPGADARAIIQADIHRDFPWRRWRLARGAVRCRCARHWYGNPMAEIVEYRRIWGRWFWRVSPAPVVNPATAVQQRPNGIGPDIADLVCRDILARKAEGAKKYGQPLRAFNGRSALVDAYQEVLDLAQYLRQAIAEQDAMLSGKSIPNPKKETP